MKIRETSFPESFSRHTINLCTGINIYTLEDLIIYLKLGHRIKNLTRSSKYAYDEIINALPQKIRRDYLNRSIDITKHFTIDYAFSRGDQELFFQYKIETTARYLCAQNNIDSYKTFISFLKGKNRILDMLGAKYHHETSMLCLMPEHIKGWYIRFHVLGMKQPFSKVNAKSNSIDRDFLSGLTPRAKNLALYYGLYNRNHFEAVFRLKINLGVLHGMGKSTVQEFQEIVSYALEEN